MESRGTAASMTRNVLEGNETLPRAPLSFLSLGLGVGADDVEAESGDGVA